VARTCGPHRPADLEVSLGPLMVGHLTTGLLWQAIPVHRLTFRPRRPTLASLAGALGVATASLWGGVLLGLAVAIGMLLESLLMRRLVGAAVRSTTEGAPAWPGH
jgi:hypothetical protein